MSQSRWKDSSSRAMLQTQPTSIFHKSVEKRRLIEDSMRMFTLNNFSQSNITIPPVKHVDFTLKDLLEEQPQGPEQAINALEGEDEKPELGRLPDYSMSLKLSDSGVGLRQKRDDTLYQDNLQEQFYELRESGMISGRSKVDPELKSFPFNQALVEGSPLPQEHTIAEQQVNQELNCLLKQTMKPQINKTDTQAKQDAVQDSQHKLSDHFPHESIQTPQPIGQTKSPVHQPTSVIPQKRLDNSSGNFLFTSDFHNYMEARPEENGDLSQSPLNETVKSNILDKVFGEQIREPEFLDYDDLNQIKNNNSKNRMANLLELGYKRIGIDFVRDLVGSLNLSRNQIRFLKRSRERKLYLYFMHIKLYKEYKLWKDTRKLKAQHFGEKLLSKRAESCFQHLKRLTFEPYEELNQRVGAYRAIKTHSLELAVMKAWKMMLFSNKIEREAVRFRLGTLFRGWHSLTRQTSKQNMHKAVKFYYLSLVRRIVNAWIDGVNFMREEKEKKYLSGDFNRSRLLRKAWRGWALFVQEEGNNKQGDFIPIQYTVEHKIGTKKSTTVGLKQ